MKKNYLLLLPVFLLCSLTTYAVTRMVSVGNNFFSPASMSVNVGDVIQWNWSAGFHTTTSTSVPAGANTWDNPINSGSTTFSYTVTTAGTYNYFCSVHGVSMSGSFTATALPLELRSFDGKTAGSTNWLYWETLTEKEVQAHIVERSADGTHWTEVGRRAGAGNSTVAISYELEDLKPFNQTYYRLRSVDIDGKVAISKVILLGEPFTITSAFPNPMADRITVQFVATAEESLRLSVMDLNGRLVWYQAVETKPGLNTTVVPLPHLKAGAYDLILSSGQRVAASIRVMKE